MSAYHALDAARAAGIEVQLDGNDLVLSGASAPPTDVLDKLRKYKLSIVALLQKPPVPRDTFQPTQPWDPDDWRAFYNEQVRIAEYDGLSRPAAKARAYGSSVAEWLWCTSVVSAPGPCPICGDADRPNDPLLAYGFIGGRYWLHKGCATTWCSSRTAEAGGALGSMGISPPDEMSGPREPAEQRRGIPSGTTCRPGSRPRSPPSSSSGLPPWPNG